MATRYQEHYFEFGQTLGDIFGVIGRNFGSMIGLIALFILVPAILQIGVAQMTLGSVLPDPLGSQYSNAEFFTPAILAIILLAIVGCFLLYVALIEIILADLMQRRVTFADALRVAVRKFFPVLAIALLYGLSLLAIYLMTILVLGIVVGLFAVGIGASGAGPGAAGFIGLIFVVGIAVPVLILVTGWLVPIPAYLSEKIGIFRSLGRSWELTRGERWKIFGLVLIISLITGAVFGLFTLLIIPLLIGSGAAGMSLVATIVLTLFQCLINFVYWTMLAALHGALYVNLRRAKEGLADEETVEIFG